MSKEYAMLLPLMSLKQVRTLDKLFYEVGFSTNEHFIEDVLDNSTSGEAVIYVDWNDEYLSHSSLAYYKPFKTDYDECTAEHMIRKLKELKDFRELGNSPAEEQNNDVANQDHYKNQGIEPIDYMRSTFTQDEFRGFLRGNVTKYLARHKDKNGLEDLKKAQVYLGWLIEDWEEDK